MKQALSLLSCLMLLSACGDPVITSQRTDIVDGNKLQITSAQMSTGRYITIENVDKHWVGKLEGGKEKWVARRDLLQRKSEEEIREICGEWFYMVNRPPTYNMMDKDETMGGAAPILGIGASMVAYMAAYSATDEANIPVSVYSEFACRKDSK